MSHCLSSFCRSCVVRRCLSQSVLACRLCVPNIILAYCSLYLLLLQSRFLVGHMTCCTQERYWDDQLVIALELQAIVVEVAGILSGHLN